MILGDVELPSHFQMRLEEFEELRAKKTHELHEGEEAEEEAGEEAGSSSDSAEEVEAEVIDLDEEEQEEYESGSEDMIIPEAEIETRNQSSAASPAPESPPAPKEAS